MRIFDNLFEFLRHATSSVLLETKILGSKFLWEESIENPNKLSLSSDRNELKYYALSTLEWNHVFFKNFAKKWPTETFRKYPGEKNVDPKNGERRNFRHDSAKEINFPTLLIFASRFLSIGFNFGEDAKIFSQLSTCKKRVFLAERPRVREKEGV